MDDLISRAEALKSVKKHMVDLKGGSFVSFSYVDPEDLKKLPSKHVIVCKDCRFFVEHRCIATRGLDDWRGEQDFCSRAERREE